MVTGCGSPSPPGEGRLVAPPLLKTDTKLNYKKSACGYSTAAKAEVGGNTSLKKQDLELSICAVMRHELETLQIQRSSKTPQQ